MKKTPPLFEGRVYFFLVFCCYLGLFIAIFPDVVFFGMSFIKRDVLRYYYPVWHYGVECMKHGALPLWNPYNCYGVPFLADIQTCVFYPFQAFLYLPNFCWGFNFYILWHVVLAGFFTCIWMRECGASRGASFLSGLAFSLGGYVTSAISLTISLCSLVYFPLVLLCLRRAFRDKNFGWKAAASVVLLCQYLAGDPAVLFATLLVATFITLYKTAATSFEQKKFYWKYLFDFTQIVVVFLGLTAFQSLIFAEFLFQSNRAAPSFDLVTMWSMQYNDLLSFIFPFFSDSSLFFMDYWIRQSWLENAYIGLTVFLLACLAWRYNKANIVGYHVLLALLGVALALGRFCYLYRFLYDWFPFFRFIRYPVRFVFVTHFATACLAGFGLDALLYKLDRKEKTLLSRTQASLFSVSLAVSAGAVLLSMLLSPWISGAICAKIHPWIQQWSHLKWTMLQVIDMVTPVLVNLKRCAVFALFTLLGIFCVLHFKVRKMIFSVFFILLIFGDLVETNVTELRVERRLLEKVSQNMRLIQKDPGLFRAQASPSIAQFQMEPPALPFSLEDMFDMLVAALSPNLLLPQHIFYSAGYDSLYVDGAFQLNSLGKSIQHPAEYRYLDMLNIKYTVSLRKDLDKTYHFLQYEKPCYLYSNEKVLPRAFLVPDARIGASHAEVLDKILSKDFDPEAWIYLEEKPQMTPQDLRPERLDRQNKVEIIRYSPSQVDMSVSSTKSQWLFFSDMFYPGWKAFVNRQPVKIYRANYTFRAIQIPVGNWKVEWKYEPILFRIGVMVTFLTALGLCFYGLRKRRGNPA